MSATAPRSSMSGDVASAYAATGAKIGAWVVVLGLIYRADPVWFAMFALVRGTIGILNYTSLGLAPAMIRLLAEVRPTGRAPDPPPPQGTEPPTLSYYTPEPQGGVQSLYANGLVIALCTGAIGVLVAIAYAGVFDQLYRMPYRLEGQMFWVVLWLGLGTVLRLMSDAPGSLLQAHDLIRKDNWRLVEAELVWTLLSVFALTAWPNGAGDPFQNVAFCFTVSGAILFLRRARYAQKLTHLLWPQWKQVDVATLRRLIGFGSLVLFAQLADYLYAPADYILINRLLGWKAVATYTPAMQIDSGLLLLVAGVSSVILPKTALADAGGDSRLVRRYYLYGTLASAAGLAFAALIVWLLREWILRLWLGDPMPDTQAILPLVLVHTVVGGSGAVGRSILIGMGKVRAFTISVLIAGVSNVVLSYIFVRHFDLGLNGIVLGTIVVVLTRAGIWMPWYVLRTLDRKS